MRWGQKKAWTTGVVQPFAGFGRGMENRYAAVKEQEEMAAQQKTGSEDGHKIPEAIEFLPLSVKPENKTYSFVVTLLTMSRLTWTLTS